MLPKKIKKVVNSVWSQLDLEKNERTRFQRTLVFDTEKQVKLVHSGRSVPIRNKYNPLIVFIDIEFFSITNNQSKIVLGM